MALTFNPDEQVQEQPTMAFDPLQKSVPESAIPGRAAKYDFAMGEDSPGVDALQADLRSTGGEYAKQTQTSIQNLKFEQAKLDSVFKMIQSQPADKPFSNDEVNFIMNMDKQDAASMVDSENIMETTYAKRFMQTIVQRDEAQSFDKVGQVQPEVAHIAMDAGEFATTRNMIAHTILDNLEEDKKNQSWPGAVGDFIGSVMPMSNMRLENIVKQAPTTSALPGSNIAEQISYLHTLPPDQFRHELYKAIDSISNNDLKIQFVSATIQLSDAGVFLTNAQTLLDAFDVAATGKAFVKGAAKLIENGAGKQLYGLVKGAVVASKARTPNAGQVAATVGNFQTSATVKAVKAILGTPIHDAEKVADAAVSITNPSKLLTNSLPNLSREAEQRVVDAVQSGSNLAIRILEQDTIARTSVDRALLVADAKAQEVFADQLRGLQSSVLDIDSSGQVVGKIAISKSRSLYPPRGAIKAKTFNPPVVLSDKQYTVEPSQLTNSEVLNIALGQKNGMLFGNEASALKFAKDNIKDILLGPEDIRQQGSGYYINVAVDLPDQLDNFQHLSVPVDRHAESPLSALLGRMFSTQSLLSNSNQAARKQLTSGSQKMFEDLTDLIEPITKVSKEEKAGLDLVWGVESNTTSASGRGKTFGTIGEFQQEYWNQTGAWPSEAATTAYYRQMQLEDLEGLVGNGRKAGDDIRLGIHQWNDKYDVPNPKGSYSVSGSFKGKEIDAIPWNDGNNSAIAVKDPLTNVIKVYQKNMITNKKVKQLIEDIKTKGGRIVQVTEPDFVIPGVSTKTNIRFYVSPDPVRERTSLYQFWKAGHRVIDNSEAYVKQGKILLDKAGKRGVHIGDTSIFGAASAKMAKEVAGHMETARQMMLRSDPALDAHVSKNVGDGVTGKDFIDMFKDKRNAQGKIIPGLDPNTPISWSKRGGRTSDNFKYNEHYGAQGIHIQDETRSPYNLTGSHLHEFDIERGLTNLPALIEEKGVRRLKKDGNTLNIQQLTSRSAKKIVDIHLKRDYVIKSANDFMEQFGEHMKATKQELARDPIYHLYNPEYKTNLDKNTLRSAENARNAIVRFMSNLNPDESALEAYRAGLVAKGGIAETYATWMLPFVEATPRALRTFATHLKMGLLNPVQFVVQGQGAATAMLISPKAGLYGASIYTPLRAALINPRWLDHSAGVAKMFGWKVDEFKEMYSSLRQSGWSVVRGDMAILDQIENPQLIRTAKGKASDISLFFMTEGERLNRLVSYATSYKEWKLKNPNKALDRNGRTAILSRADDMTQNMTSSSNAMWQKGLLGVPAQFLTYQARLIEQYATSLAGKGNLTRGEALRLFVGHSVMYGVPTAVAGATGFPAYEFLKDYLVKNDIKHKDAVVEAFLNGVAQAAIHSATGIDAETGPRFGSGGFSAIHDLWTGSKSFTELALGVSGGSIGELVGNTYPFIRGAWQAMTTDPAETTYPFDEETIMRVFSSASAINNDYKMIYALNTGKWLSKYGRNLDNVSGAEAVYSALTGATLSRLAEMYTMREIGRMQKRAAAATALTVVDYYKRSMKEGLNQNERNDYIRQAKAYAVIGGMSDQDIMKAMRTAMDQMSEDQVDQVKRNWEQDLIRRDPNREDN